jgi:hypothetical protein
MLKRWYMVVFIMFMAILLVTPTPVAGEFAQTFRQQIGLLPHTPPALFLEGYFIARERDPVYVFGPVQDFVRALGGTTTWLIEDAELKRVERATGEGGSAEYSLFLEVVSPERTEYWVFVVLPHKSGQEWFDARRAYHGRKAEGYYGKTKSELERAFSQGVTIKGELRFFIEKGDISLESPEEAIIKRYKFQPVFDLTTGRWVGSAAESK